MKLQSLPCYCATLRQAARAVTALYEEVLADSDLHATQYTALQVLKFVPNLTTTDLADAMGIDQTTATRTLALVRKNGLVIDTPPRQRSSRKALGVDLGRRDDVSEAETKVGGSAGGI
jgi:DNA-binding MarR family transcriptional regulator